MYQITFIVPYPELVRDVEEVFHHHPMHSRLRKRVEVIGAEELDRHYPDLARTSDVLVARGYTAQRLKGFNPTIPVVTLPISSYDIIRAVKECISHYHPSRIALIGLMVSQNESEVISSIFSCEIRTYQAPNVADITAQVTKAIKDGCDALIGGYSVTLSAAAKQTQCVTIKTGEAAIRLALDEAIRAVEITRHEREQAEMHRTITASAKDGILYVSNDLVIRVANPAGSRQSPDKNNVIGRRLTDVFPFMTAMAGEVLSGGKEHENHLIKSGESMLSINYFPVIVRERVTGVVITMQDVTKIQSLETRIRQKLSEKGLEARYRFEDIIHVSPAIDKLIDTARRYASVPSNVLIEGETGTGKELLAQSIHNASPRQSGPFVAVNCAAIPENLLESEMFGYVEGAFTGSVKGGKTGLFELAHNGTLFLDEVAELPISFQSKLLRVLQEREVRPVGGNKVKSVDVRIIAAANCCLKNHVNQGRFRQDLFYRLDVLKLSVPPLRRRPEDIEVLFLHFLNQFSNERFGNSMPVDPAAVALLRSHEFAGNVREIRNIAERASILCMDCKVVLTDHIMEALGQAETFDPLPGTWFESIQTARTDPSEERERIVKALVQNEHNQSRTARELGIDRTTLWRKIQKYNITKRQI